MCNLFGGGNKAEREARQAREEAEAREAKRQADIALGKQNIDKSFEQFDDRFFSGFDDAYRENYIPQIDKQHGKASSKLAATLADRGVLESTPGINQFADLQDRYGEARAQVANDALAATNELRGRVTGAKTDLYGMNAVSADPQAAGALATGQATALAAPQSFSPLGQVFASFLDTAGAFSRADRNSASPVLPFNRGPQLYNPSGSGSSRVVT